MEQFFNRLKTNQSRVVGKIPRWVLIIVISTLPLLLTLGFARFVLHSSMDKYHSLYGNDDVYYVGQIAAFDKAGFNGGYFAYREMIPKLSFNHFGVHGFVFPITYGLIGKVTGWGYSTFIYIQTILLGLGFAFFAWRSKISQNQILLSGLALVTCFPVLAFTLSTLEENFHQAMGLFLAGALTWAITRQHKLPAWQKIGLLIFLIYIGIIRYTWIMFLIPVVWLIFPKNWKGILISLGVIVGVAAITFILYNFTVSPGYNNALAVIVNFQNGLRPALHEIKAHIILPNIDQILHPWYATWVVTEFQYLFIMFLVGIDGIILFAKKKHLPDPSGMMNQRFLVDATLFFAMFSFACFCFFIFTMNNAFRLLSATLIIASLLLVWSKRYLPVVIVILSSLITIPFLLDQIKDTQQGKFVYDIEKMEITKTELEKYIIFDPKTDNPWCNTVFTETDLPEYQVLYIPAGIGVSYYIPQYSNQKPPFPLQSKYVILIQSEFDRMDENFKKELKLLAGLPESDLYINLDAQCP